MPAGTLTDDIAMSSLGVWRTNASGQKVEPPGMLRL